MKKYYIAFLLLACFAKAYSQEAEKTDEVAFQAGEQITYKLKYGIFNAAEAVINVENSAQKFDGKPALRVYATAKTLGTFNLLFKVRNQYQTFINPTTLLPYYYSEERKEGGYKHDDKLFLTTTPAL